MKRPLIGITLDIEQAGGYAGKPWYALKADYCDAVYRAGGIPLPLPHVQDLIPHYINLIDGLLITGGPFDIDPKLYGPTDIHPSVRTKDERTAFEWEMLQECLHRDIPVLGICGGHQLIAVVSGGTLYQHIADEEEGALQHLDPNAGKQIGHDVLIHPGTQLYGIIGRTDYAVNTSHHQAIKTIPDHVVVSSRAPDGIIESIEIPDKRFCLGVQWHPECAVNPDDAKILEAFIEAAAA